MSAKSIAAYLQSDVTDSTAGAVRAANPGKWAADNLVPPYLYTSLKTLWTPPSQSTLDFQNRVIGNSGQGKTKATGYIEVVPYMFENAFNPETLLDDETGSESGVIWIFFSIPRPVSAAQFGQVEQAELRIRLLLDMNWRNKAGSSNQIPINGDLSIDSNGYMLCKFDKFLNDPNESEVLVQYVVNYVRSVAKTILP